MLFETQSKSGYPIFFIFVILLSALITRLTDWRLQALLVLGLILGASFNYFQFGFTRAWYDLVVKGKTEGVRSHFLVIGLGSLIMTPFLILGDFGGIDLQGLVRPIAVSGVLGAFIFGVGMQLAGSCSSGTLVKLGQFYPLSIITFICLFIGGLTGAYLFEYWMALPMIAPISFTLELGYLGLVINLLLVGLVYYALLIWDKESRDQSVGLIYRQVLKDPSFNNPRFLITVLIIALSSLGVLLVSGQPWSIASVFTLWSLKFSELIGIDLGWEFWDVSTLYGTRMANPFLDDPITLTTLGFILGAILITLLGKRESERPWPSCKLILYSIIGGLLMGFGATISFGCNIGAFLSGIMSGSLHGWLWIFWAGLGNLVAIKWILRP